MDTGVPPVGFFAMFDPLYWMLIGPALLLALWAQIKVKSAYARFSRVGTTSGMTGAQAAAEMLRREGVKVAIVNDVNASSHDHDRQTSDGICRIELTQGFLSDHYDPRARVLRLSPDVFGGRSISSVGIACHEAGHALQHAYGYAPLALRTALVPVTMISSNLAIPLIIAGAIFNMMGLAQVGVIVFGVTVVFQLITLPVEFNASSRAKLALVNNGVIRNEEEIAGVNSVLNAAAMTYVAATIAAAAQLLYYAIRLGLIGGRRDD